MTMRDAQVRKRGGISALLNRYGIELVFVILFVYGCFGSKNFFTLSNQVSVLRQISITAPIAIAMTFVIINGNIDISVGGIVGLSGMVAVIMDSQGLPLPLTLLTALGIGLVTGLINAYYVYKGLAPYIITMSTNLILRGLCQLITNGQPVWGISDTYKVIGQGFLFGDSVPVPIVIFIVVFIIGWYVLEHTTAGRTTYAVGGNREAARLAGISVLKSKIFVFCVSGACAALTGIVLSSRLGSCDPTVGVDYQVDAIAATVIGGTAMSGGEGRLTKTLIGILIVGFLSNIMNLTGINPYLQNVLKGVIIFVAVVWDNSRRSKNK